MSFRENLIYLRTSRGMTQEQLASMLDVSRQSVTKWESDKSVPEMDKLIKMCGIFDCTLDGLVLGNLAQGKSVDTDETVREEPDEAAGRGPIPAAPEEDAVDLYGYDDLAKRFAQRIANGAFFAILCAGLGIAFFSMAPDGDAPVHLPENIAVFFGLICTFIGIATCVAFVVPIALEKSSFMREHPRLPDFYTPEQKQAVRVRFTYDLVGGIALILLGVGIVILFESTPYEVMVGIPLMMAFIAIGVRFIVVGSVLFAETDIAEYNREASVSLTTEQIAASGLSDAAKQELTEAHYLESRVSAVCAAIMLIATMVGLVMLFVPGYQNPYFWLSWVIGGLLCGLTSVLMKGFSRS